MENQVASDHQSSQQLNQAHVEQNPISKKKTNLWVILFAILLTAIIFGTGGYYFGQKSSILMKNSVQVSKTPSPNIFSTETYNPNLNTSKDNLPENWITYKSDSLGFTIQYPADEVIVDQEIDGEMIVFTLNKYQDTPSYPPTALRIMRRGSQGDTPLFALSSESSIVEGEPKVASYEGIQINNAVGLRTTSGFASDHNYYLTDISKKGTVLRIDAGSDINENVDVFVKMIETFEFIR